MHETDGLARASPFFVPSTKKEVGQIVFYVNKLSYKYYDKLENKLIIFRVSV